MKTNSKSNWPEYVLATLSFGGALLLALGYSDIVRLTPLYLLINVGLIIIKFGCSQRLWELLGIAAVVGFFAELLGVKTGLLFGDYVYGSVLGPKLFDVPVMVGGMWALVMSVLWSVLPKSWGIKRIPAAASLAVTYDLVLEHFATRYDLWSWAGRIPVSNYLGWFIVSFVISGVFHYRNYTLKTTTIALYTLPLHIIFFALAVL